MNREQSSDAVHYRLANIRCTYISGFAHRIHLTPYCAYCFVNSSNINKEPYAYFNVHLAIDSDTYTGVYCTVCSSNLANFFPFDCNQCIAAYIRFARELRQQGINYYSLPDPIKVFVGGTIPPSFTVRDFP